LSRKVGNGVIEAERNEALITWHQAAGRDLPWRHTNDPHQILVSEVMLQQTQVDRVVPYFERFIDRYPTVPALAAAGLRDVLAEWSGLGYNSRAQRLHQAARDIERQGWPKDVHGLMQLPGVGIYTARAIACFAFGSSAIPVDTNIRRVLNRWHGTELSDKLLGDTAGADRLSTPAANWTQAVMDLGATCCRPRAPGCGSCPGAAWCSGPETYLAPPRQSPFEGSARQVRGAVVRELLSGPTSAEALHQATGFSSRSIEAALTALAAEQLVHAASDTYRLPD